MALLIAGGTGFIGRSLSQIYRTKGLKVYIVTRNPKGNEQLSWSTLKSNGFPEDVDTVINLSGRSIGEMSPFYIFDKYYQPFRKELFESRLSTTKLIVDILKTSSKPPNLFINSSAIGIYKPSLTESYTESSAYVDHDWLTDLCKQWEAASKIPDKPNIRQIQLRTGLVLGSGGGMLQNMYLPFKLCLGGPIGNGRQWMSWIHIIDIFGIIDHIRTHKSIASGPFNATAPNPVTNKEFASTLGRALHRMAVLPMPKTTVKLMFGERATMVLEGQKVLPQRALESGYQFKYPYLGDALSSIYVTIP